MKVLYAVIKVRLYNHHWNLYLEIKMHLNVYYSDKHEAGLRMFPLSMVCLSLNQNRTVEVQVENNSVQADVLARHDDSCTQNRLS